MNLSLLISLSNTGRKVGKLSAQVDTNIVFASIIYLFAFASLKNNSKTSKGFFPLQNSYKSIDDE